MGINPVRYLSHSSYNTNLSVCVSVCQVEHPTRRHDASLLPHRQRVPALRRNLPAHAHVWALLIRRLAPSLRHGTALRRAPRPHWSREYTTHTHTKVMQELNLWHLQHKTEIKTSLKMSNGLHFLNLIWSADLSQNVPLHWNSCCESADLSLATTATQLTSSSPSSQQPILVELSFLNFDFIWGLLWRGSNLLIIMIICLNLWFISWTTV